MLTCTGVGLLGAERLGALAAADGSHNGDGAKCVAIDRLLVLLFLFHILLLLLDLLFLLFLLLTKKRVQLAWGPKAFSGHPTGSGQGWLANALDQTKLGTGVGQQEPTRTGSWTPSGAFPFHNKDPGVTVLRAASPSPTLTSHVPGG